MESLYFFIGLGVLVISSVIIFSLIFRENVSKALFVLTILAAASFVLYNQYESIKGLPSGNDIENNFVLKDYIIDKKGGLIYLWIIFEDTSYPINFKIPYSDEKREELRKLKNGLEGGSIVKIEGEVIEDKKGKFELRFFGLKLEDAPEMQKRE